MSDKTKWDALNKLIERMAAEDVDQILGNRVLPKDEWELCARLENFAHKVIKEIVKTNGVNRPTEYRHDVCRGAREIAHFLGVNERRARWLVEGGNLPTFREGSAICMRKSVYMQTIAEREMLRA